MLNKERIRLMTQMAAYEQAEGKDTIKMGQYYRKDYVGMQMLKTFFCSTIAFGILFVLQIFYELDVWLEEFYRMDIEKFAGMVLIKYLVFVIIYQVIAYIVYNIRYKRGHKSVKRYYHKLKKVERYYEKEENNQSLDDWED